MHDLITTRRAFIQKGLTLLAATSTVPAFLDQTVWAMTNPADLSRIQQPYGNDGTILVVVQLSGGNDGLNTIVPWADDEYHRRRPGLAIDPKTVLKIDNYLGMHPNLAGIKALFDDGRLSLIQGVGYPNPNRSHFRSMDIWHSANPADEQPTDGWLGRYFDNTCSGADPHVGVSLDERLPLAMQGSRVIPLSFERPEAYRYAGKDTDAYLRLNTREAPTTRPAGKGNDLTAAGQLDFLHRTAMDAQLTSDQILRITRAHTPAAEYPRGKFADGLRTVAAMIRGGLPTRVYYVSLGGFDTHANQRGRHDNLMLQFNDGVKAFWADLKAQKNDDRVLMMTFSEFGRRVEQNASGGTDHGAAAPMMLIGPKLKPGIVGQHPSLNPKMLDQGDLRYGIDFRSVYATVLQKWLETPSRPILGAQFQTLALL